MYILGINGGVRLGYQDVSAVLLEDGRVIAAMEEERLNRVKHAPGQIPELSVQSVLEYAGISMRDVGLIVSHGSTWGEEYSEKLREYFRYRFGHCPPIERVHHHDAHAASAYYGSGFNEALVVTVDNSGDGVSTQIMAGRDGYLSLITRIERPNSLGMFYSMITQFCGFRRDSDEYKLMGLSAYGNRDAFDLTWLLAEEKSAYRLNTDYLKKVAPGQPQPSRQELLFNSKLVEKLGQPRSPGSTISDFYADIAASAQQRLEDVLCHLIRSYLKAYNLSNVCLAGGVALNCVANQKIMAIPEVEKLYIQPASSDAGISLGAAWLGAVSRGIKPEPPGTTYLGDAFSNKEIQSALELLKAPSREVDDPAAVAAWLVAEGKIVGWFQGRMEFGPRALGARSILANPCLPEMKDILNERIKFRESFRPFCPSLLEEDFALYFSGKQKRSPYMTITYDALPEAGKHIPAAIHIDNTARIQTVTARDNPLFYNYLTGLKRLTGHGVTINTSFNVRGQPIVQHPLHAISTFYGSGMDALVIGNFVLEK